MGSVIEQEGRAIDESPGQILRGGEAAILELFVAQGHVSTQLDEARVDHDGLLSGGEFFLQRNELRIHRQGLAGDGEGLYC